MEPTVSPNISNFEPAFVLGSEGPIAKHFNKYEPRIPQIQMADAVRNNLKQLRHLFCEAGTGTGKSYAFLIPAIEAALRGEGPVVVSTNTIALQEQIFNKDIPDLKKYLNLPNLRVVLRKGRGNYLSRRRHKAAQNYDWAPNEINQMEDIDRWVDESSTGAVQELDFIPSSALWEEVRSDQYDCLGKKCPYFAKCFYFKSKEEAEKAHIIVTNHSLLALDLGVKAKTAENVGILPVFKHLIIDEAHALEEAIRKAETFEWKQGSAANLTKRAFNKKDSGFLDMLHKTPGVPSKTLMHAKEAVKHLQHFVEVNAEFFSKDVGPFLEEKKQVSAATSKRVKAGDLQSERSESLIATLRGANNYLQNIVTELKRISEGEGGPKPLKDVASLLENFWGNTKEVESDLKRAISADKSPDEPYHSHVSSAEATIINDRAYFMLVSTPIFVRQITQEILFSKIPSITLTSATLTVSGNFNHVKRNLGALEEKADTLLLPHVFDYKNQVKLCLTPKALLDPWNDPKERERYYDDLARRIDKYVKMTKGNAFVLCTSNSQMRSLYKRLKDQFSRLGMNVMCQGEGLTREQLVQEFKAIPNSVLFAVDSFWTGVDIPGDHLQNVIITKLPFPPPSPLSEAQQEVYDYFNRGKPRNKQRDYFSDRTIPDVAIKIQQGFGRLIRHREDKGIVVIMDPRMLTKPYGKVILASLPECNTVVDES